MNTLTREDFVEALKVPVIMGRGEPYGVVIGIRRFGALYAWAKEYDQALSTALADPQATPLGMHMIVTTRYQDTFFAVTEKEHADMMTRFTSVDGPANTQ